MIATNERCLQILPIDRLSPELVPMLVLQLFESLKHLKQAEITLLLKAWDGGAKMR